MSEENNIKQKYLELQTINQQIQQLHQQFSLLEQQRTDLINISQSLDDLDKVKSNSKMYAPLGGGLYVEGSIKNTKKVLAAVGAGVMLPKTLQETKENVEGQVDEIQSVLQQVEKKVQDFMKKGQELHREILALSEKQQKNGK